MQGDQRSSRAEPDHCKINETSIEEEGGSQEDENPDDTSNSDRRTLSISQRINRDLDETAQMLEKLTQSLFSGESVAANGVAGSGSGESSGVVKRMRRDWGKSRHSTVSASISEPDLTQVHSNTPVKVFILKITLEVHASPLCIAMYIHYF